MPRRVKLEIELEDEEVDFIKLDTGVTGGITSDQLEAWLFDTIQKELDMRKIAGNLEEE